MRVEYSHTSGIYHICALHHGLNTRNWQYFMVFNYHCCSNSIQSCKPTNVGSIADQVENSYPITSAQRNFCSYV